MKLHKTLSLFDIYCIATGAMISSGLFILPGYAHAKAGPAVVFSYFLAGLLALPGMLSQAELVSAMPKAGGTYFYVTRSMGPAAGTVNGVITWFSMTLKSAFALVGMAAFASLLVNMDIRLIGVVFCAVFTALNLLGIKEAGRLQNVLVTGFILILAYYIVRGAPRVNVHNFVPFAPHGLTGIFSSAGFVFISYGGLLKAASIAEEAKDPARTVPLGMIFSLITVIILYTVVVFITSGVLGAADLDYSMTPISDGAGAILGKRGRIILSIAAVFAFISTANAGIMAASRYPLALSRDKLLPSAFARINKKFGTPHIAILFTGLICSLFLFLKLDILVKTASTVLILTFIFSCLSVIIMRESGVQNYRPKFYAPFYPWLQIIGVVFFSILLFEMGREALFSSLLLVLGGLFIYWYYGRVKTNREFALLHLIEKITAKELTSRNLEAELKEIIQERDDIVKDRFDTIIENCSIIDIDKSLTVEEFFTLAAEKLGDRLNMDPSHINELLFKRENEYSTIIAPGLAIPHIIIDGEKKFDILLARCRPGIVFSDTFNEITTVFILVGTRDERNFHLRALSSIAQIIHDHHFPKRWLAARTAEDLRDIILLGKRTR